MNTIVDQSYPTEKDPPVDENKKPKFFSKTWWLLLLGAFALWKYTPKHWAIWTLSSNVTLAQVFGFKFAYEAIEVHAPWVITTCAAIGAFAKTAITKAIAVAVAIWNVASP